MKIPFIIVAAASASVAILECSSTTPAVTDDSGTSSSSSSSGAGSSSGPSSSSGSSGGSGSSSSSSSSSGAGSSSSSSSGSTSSNGGSGSGSLTDSGSSASSSSGVGTLGGDGSSSPNVDASAADGPIAAADASDSTIPSGQYTCTLNATTPYHLGAEHRTYWLFGTVIDTTPGANRARVGAIQSFLDTNDLLKWVWPKILTPGHTYELAIFEDHLRNRMCMGANTTTEPQFLLQIPAVIGDFEYKWIAPVPHTASCQDFPSPIP